MRDIAGRLSHLRESGRLKIGIANTHMDADKLENYKNELQKAFPDLELIYFPAHYEHRYACRPRPASGSAP